jgi:glycerol kinase
MSRYIDGIDQGTTRRRFLVFDKGGRIVSAVQREHQQIYLQDGRVEHDQKKFGNGPLQQAMLLVTWVKRNLIDSLRNNFGRQAQNP